MNAFALALCVSLPPPSALEIDRLIKHLGSDGLAQRERSIKRFSAAVRAEYEAAKALRDLGPDAVPAILAAADNAPDPEVAKRLRLVADGIRRRVALSPEEKKFLGYWQVVTYRKAGRETRVAPGQTYEFTEWGVEYHAPPNRPVSWPAYSATGHDTLNLYGPGGTGPSRAWLYKFEDDKLILTAQGVTTVLRRLK